MLGFLLGGESRAFFGVGEVVRKFLMAAGRQIRNLKRLMDILDTWTFDS